MKIAPEIKNRLKTTLRNSILRILDGKHLKEYKYLYGEFDKNNYDRYSVNNLPNESGFCYGELVKWSKDLNPKCVLIVGETKSTAKILKDKIDAIEVFTSGLSNTDYKWNFEEDLPKIEKKFDLIVSQAILEHLLNPYKHLQDLTNIVTSKGYIIIHTVMPGFPYHRYPIDSVRFFPDWFEESANRLGLKVIRKRIRNTHIFYMYQRI
jgi:SAM-dependent methyltransferase